MDQWAQSFKLIHGKTPTKADRAAILEARTSNEEEENEKPTHSFKRAELKPPEKGKSYTKINPKFQKLLRKPEQSKKPFASPTKSVDPFLIQQSPKVDYLLKTPSPKKLLRPTNAYSNIHFLLKENADQVFDHEEEEVEEPVTLFEDELPEQSLKLQNRKENPRKRAAPSSPQGNYVKANMKRRRYVPKKSGAANKKQFKRFKRKH